MPPCYSPRNVGACWEVLWERRGYAARLAARIAPRIDVSPGGVGVHESTRPHKCPLPPVFASAWLLATRGHSDSLNHSCLSARRWCNRSGMTGIV
eukprot:2980845-Prymnesium_polylepis.1